MIFIFDFDKFGKITVTLEIYFSAKNEYFLVHKNARISEKNPGLKRSYLNCMYCYFVKSFKSEASEFSHLVCNIYLIIIYFSN